MSAARPVNTPGWSVAGFEAFWASPDPRQVAPMLTDDVRGYWPWSQEAVCGVDEYVYGH